MSETMKDEATKNDGKANIPGTLTTSARRLFEFLVDLFISSFKSASNVLKAVLVGGAVVLVVAIVLGVAAVVGAVIAAVNVWVETNKVLQGYGISLLAILGAAVVLYVIDRLHKGVGKFSRFILSALIFIFLLVMLGGSVAQPFRDSLDNIGTIKGLPIVIVQQKEKPVYVYRDLPEGLDQLGYYSEDLTSMPDKLARIETMLQTYQAQNIGNQQNVKTSTDRPMVILFRHDWRNDDNQPSLALLPGDYKNLLYVQEENGKPTIKRFDVSAMSVPQGVVVACFTKENFEGKMTVFQPGNHDFLTGDRANPKFIFNDACLSFQVQTTSEVTPGVTSTK